MTVNTAVEANGTVCQRSQWGTTHRDGQTAAELKVRQGITSNSYVRICLQKDNHVPFCNSHVWHTHSVVIILVIVVNLKRNFQRKKSERNWDVTTKECVYLRKSLDRALSKWSMVFEEAARGGLDLDTKMIKCFCKPSNLLLNVQIWMSYWKTIWTITC